MTKSIVQTLREWRNHQARIEGVEVFRIFPNVVLDAIAGTLPRNKEEMLAIKGIKEGKYRKYGSAVLKIIQEQTGDGNNGKGDIFLEASTMKDQVFIDQPEKKSDAENDGVKNDQTLSVSQFLDGLNIELSGMAARVRGEVSSVDPRERVVYFTLKDAEDGSTLHCLIFRYAYDISGVSLVIGDEIIVEGSPDIYKPSGRLSFKVGVIELFGEGALQKAYEALRMKLENDGLFSLGRKRLLPSFPERIALITSDQGAAIGDFTMNLGAQGLKVDFYPTSVEGKKAVFEIIRAIRYFNRRAEKYDVLVIVRGGGSLESLQAFNNEALVRAVAESSIPTLLGIGHEKDVTLAALVADVMVSTPTATAKVLRTSWDEARQLIEHFRFQLPLLFREQLSDVENALAFKSGELLARFKAFSIVIMTLRQDIAERLVLVQALIRQKMYDLDRNEERLWQGFQALRERVTREIRRLEALLRQYDPERVLRLGYSLVRSGKRIIKDTHEIKIGDILEVQLSQGKLKTKVEKIFEA